MVFSVNRSSSLQSGRTPDTGIHYPAMVGRAIESVPPETRPRANSWRHHPYPLRSRHPQPAPTPTALLEEALLRNDVGLARHALEKIENPNVPLSSGHLPLHYSLYHDRAITPLLLGHPDIDLNARDQNKNTALLISLMLGRMDAISRLICPTNVNTPNDSGLWPLRMALKLAIATQNTQPLQQLLRAGAYPNTAWSGNEAPGSITPKALAPFLFHAITRDDKNLQEKIEQLAGPAFTPEYCLDQYLDADEENRKKLRDDLHAKLLNTAKRTSLLDYFTFAEHDRQIPATYENDLIKRELHLIRLFRLFKDDALTASRRFVPLPNLLIRQLEQKLEQQSQYNMPPGESAPLRDNPLYRMALTNYLKNALKTLNRLLDFDLEETRLETFEIR
ncbi:ankyrin repeat domain-containing protein [Paraburkholderia hayleyella]|uniref:ankyrin repeat domain-containing protein n=1 Tax=Paraburkholderia hayleyella TaxID=2152889 RepID=UPI0012926245|nr:hypothetical protein [Paraburkholderia hayleyella]